MSSLNLTIRQKQENGVIYLYLAGEIDAYTAPQLREVILPSVERPKQKVTVDLSEIEYIDSTGLGIFIGALKASHAHNGSLVLMGMTKRVQRLFTITGLDELITIHDEKEELR